MPALWLLFVAGFVAIVWFAQRGRELFVLSVRGGRPLLVRGRIPPSLLEALGDVTARARVRHATIRVVRANGHARLSASGLDDIALQRARNVLGTHPLHRLETAPLPRSRNLGQRLGIAWLAWRLRD